MPRARARTHTQAHTHKCHSFWVHPCLCHRHASALIPGHRSLVHVDESCGVDGGDGVRKITRELLISAVCVCVCVVCIFLLMHKRTCSQRRRKGDASESITMISRRGSLGVFVDEIVCGRSATASSGYLKWFKGKT